MRIVFLGSPEFALPSLEMLMAGPHEVVAVVTQPDRPAGRGRQPAPPPVKLRAQAAGLEVLQPERVSAPEAVAEIRRLAPDILIIAAYGQILRQSVLDLPSRGALNVHASLLPRHRGASPITAAILAGDNVTGVTIMEVVRALDAGPLVACAEEPILPSDTGGSLTQRLAVLGSRLLRDTLDPWAEGKLIARPQDDSRATFAPMVHHGDAAIDWKQPALEIWRRVRAYNPWPVAFTTWKGAELRVLEAWPVQTDSGEATGAVLPLRRLNAEAAPPSEVPVVQTGLGVLALVRVQLAGRKALSGLEFVHGQRDFVGASLPDGPTETIS